MLDGVALAGNGVAGLGRLFQGVDVQVAGVEVLIERGGWLADGERVVGRQICEGGAGLGIAGGICIITFHAVYIPLVYGFKLNITHQITLSRWFLVNEIFYILQNKRKQTG